LSTLRELAEHEGRLVEQASTRRPDASAEPRRPRGEGVRAAQSPQRRDGPAADRPRRLQDDQRHARPRRRRPACWSPSRAGCGRRPARETWSPASVATSSRCCCAAARTATKPPTGSSKPCAHRPRSASRRCWSAPASARLPPTRRRPRLAAAPRRHRPVRGQGPRQGNRRAVRAGDRATPPGRDGRDGARTARRDRRKTASCAWVYQPIVRIDDGADRGRRGAGARRFQPRTGRWCPGRFIPVAERTGLVVPAGSVGAAGGVPRARRLAQSEHGSNRAGDGQRERRRAASCRRPASSTRLADAWPAHGALPAGRAHRWRSPRRACAGGPGG
jgi:hypothetical protein